MSEPFSKQLLAEAFGTFLLVFLGPTTVTAVSMLGGRGPAGIIAIAFAHGMALWAAIVTTSHVSGAHINPAVTIASWATRRFPSSKVLQYIIVQLLAAALAGFLQLLIFGEDVGKISNLGTTLPNPRLLNPDLSALGAEIVGTAILVFTIFGATSKGAPQGWAAATIGLILSGIILALGVVSGASLNPARTFGPSLASLTFNASIFNTFWIYAVGPIMGGLIGGFLYDTLKAKSEDQ